MTINKVVNNQILLLGHRAVGKSTLGKCISGLLSWPFIDLDQFLCNKFGCKNVNMAWKELGESEWRLAEARALAICLKKCPVVIACGGGILEGVLSLEIISKHKPCCVSLWASDKTMIERRKNDYTRPLLAQSLQKEVKNILPNREHRIKKASNFQFFTDNKTPQELTEMIIKELNLKIPS